VNTARLTPADRFITAYIECALWASIEGPDDTPMDRDYGLEDFAESTVQSIRLDCEQFIREQAEVLDYVDSTGEHGDTYAMAGHDFWLTRNGHGAGFWDGDWDIQLPAGADGGESGLSDRLAGDVLTAATEKFSECDLYVGDDGRVYVTPERTAAAEVTVAAE